ncbi:MAG TPA: hypothetical protein VHQ47_13160 [Phycisphaerae bacterium]|nr:hypothetical protein [Phycisphaerae bacterium]
MDSERDVIRGEGGGEDVVDRAAAAMRGMRVPGAPGGLMEKTIASARAGAGSGGAGAARAGSAMGSKQKGWWSMKMVRRTAVAAALAAAVGVGVVMAPWGGGRVAFADVVEQVKAAKVVGCKVKMEMDLGEKGTRTVTSNVVMSEEGWSITQNGTKRTVLKASPGHIEMMMLDDEAKKAIIIDSKDSGMVGGAAAGAEQVPNLLTMFQGLGTKGEEALGEKEVEGVKARGFSVKAGAGGGQTYEIWADEKTEKPVLVTMATQAMGVGARYTYSDFDWNPVVPAGLAEFRAPAGYTVTKSALDVAGMGEKDVVEMLRVVGEVNGGVLPARVDMESVMEMMKDSVQAKGAAGQTPEARQAVAAEIAPLARAWMVMGGTKYGTGWTYDGHGVAVGTKGKAVLWYKPAGKAGWRVIDADGTVHDAASAPAGGEKVKVTDMSEKMREGVRGMP